MNNKSVLILLLAILPFLSVSASAQDRGICHGKSTERPHYMGMVSVNASPYIPSPVMPGLSLHTSHGAFFPRQSVYTGVSVEAVYSVIGVATVSSHTRWFYPAADSKNAQGYVGAEAGVGLDYATGGGAFFNGAVELGAVINFRKVSIDLGIRAQFLPPFALNSFLLPVKIGLVF